MKITITK